MRGYALRAVRSRGALTEAGIAEHCRLPGGAGGMRPIVDGLAADGLVRRVAVADGGAPVVVPGGRGARRQGPAGGVLLCPFDNLLWDRAFVERVFGFRHVIEVYKREPERVYGYYVLPFLYGDRLVGRADLKTDRKESVLRVKAFHLEPGVRRFEGSRRRVRARARAPGAVDPGREGRALTEPPLEQLRRIAVHAQLLDGSATSVLETVERLGFLQLDPISTVAPAQHVVLWSRLGSRYDSSELDRLLWKERKLVEWNAYLYPAQDLPLLKALMRRRDRPHDRHADRVPEARTPRSAATCCGNSSSAGRCSRARSRITSRPDATHTAGGASARWG